MVILARKKEGETEIPQKRKKACQNPGVRCTSGFSFAMLPFPVFR